MATIDCRATKSGRERWRVRIRRRGYSEVASFGTRSEAVRWAREVEGAIERGEWASSSPGGGPTFSRLLSHYLTQAKPSRDTRRQLVWWRRRLGSKVAAEVSSQSILKLRQELAEEVIAGGRRRSLATVNRYVSALSALFSWALRSGHLQEHPVRRIEPLAESPTRLRCLSEQERESLVSACGQIGGLRLQALVVLALSTGARRGELLRLRWSDLDIAKRQVLFRGCGRQRARRLPLFRPVMRLLRRMSKVRRIDGDDLFADAHGRVVFPRAAWTSALKKAGIEDFRFHDLRHSAAAYLVMSGASLAEIAEILGSMTVQAVQRYAPLAASKMTAAISTLEDRVGGE